MNEKVTQMVELLFRDVQPSEEVLALHDEVLNNCQDRFADLIRGGLAENEALAAVMESLKGMEDVLQAYPRRGESDSEAAPEGDAEAEKNRTPSLLSFEPEDILSIDAQLTNCDVEVRPSEGSFSLETRGEIFSELQPDGTLRLWQKKSTDKIFENIDWEQSFNSFESFGDALNRLGRNLSSLFSRSFTVNGSESRVLLCIPSSSHPGVQIRTTSGDILWSEVVPGQDFSLASTSGDIRVRLDRSYLMPKAAISTTSGDAEVTLSAEDVSIVTVSGDLSWEGNAHEAVFSSTSGDLEVTGEVQHLEMNSTSGDLSLHLTEGAVLNASFNTVSGDIKIRLPAAVNAVNAELNSVSGDLRLRGIDRDEASPVQIEANTVSGDLKIEN